MVCKGLYYIGIVCPIVSKATYGRLPALQNIFQGEALSEKVLRLQDVFQLAFCQ